MSAPRRVVVVGGGLAGITAAIALRETGAEVVLLEAKPWLGGATCSFTRDGLVVDTGQHVFLRCCAAYRGLLDRLGVTASARLQSRFDVTVLRPGQSPGDRPARLRRTALPGPLHMGLALARYQPLSLTERLRTTQAALAMKRLDPADPAVDGQSLGDWLAARGQSEHARRALWDLFTVSALNVAGDDANLALAATVVQTALLGAKDAADLGVPAIPLGDLHGNAALEHLGRLGAEVRLGAKVTGIEVAQDSLPGIGRMFAVRLGRQAQNGLGEGDPVNGEAVHGSKSNGSSADGQGNAAIEADGVVIAVPPDQAARLFPQAVGEAGWRELGTSPIVNVHVVYDRPVMDLPFAAAVDSPVQWVFDRTGPSGLARDPERAGGQYLAVSVSAADEQVDVPAAKLREIFVPALAELLAEARTARVTDFFVTRERRATFRQVPGCEGLRPPAATDLPGLVLAGAWTNTGWPDTMEGAVRSGLNAARELRRTLGVPTRVTTAVSDSVGSHPAGAGA
ncbi:MAG TPA: FAD-dependent oxidoreductase [Streptosporangiaceae bacterium]|nr:FAD-dependent oxidoreductase [Streptosporangiaceae bacterium]